MFSRYSFAHLKLVLYPAYYCCHGAFALAVCCQGWCSLKLVSHSLASFRCSSNVTSAEQASLTPPSNRASPLNLVCWFFITHIICLPTILEAPQGQGLICFNFRCTSSAYCSSWHRVGVQHNFGVSVTAYMPLQVSIPITPVYTFLSCLYSFCAIMVERRWFFILILCVQMVTCRLGPSSKDSWILDDLITTP